MSFSATRQVETDVDVTRCIVRGVLVHGIELSPVRVEGTFTLAYLVRNTITNLTSQEQQVPCFCNVAAHLETGGCFVIEVYIPELRRLLPGETVHPFGVTPTHLCFEQYDLSLIHISEPTRQAEIS